MNPESLKWWLNAVVWALTCDFVALYNKILTVKSAENVCSSFCFSGWLIILKISALSLLFLSLQFNWAVLCDVLAFQKNIEWVKPSHSFFVGLKLMHAGQYATSGKANKIIIYVNSFV